MKPKTKKKVPAPRAARAAEPMPPPGDDDEKGGGEGDGEEDEDNGDAMADCAAACRASADACSKAADAYTGAADALEGGSDSISALMAAESASSDARTACEASGNACASLRGADQEQEPPAPNSKPLPPAPGPGARAVAGAAAVPTAASHLEVARMAALGRAVLARLKVPTPEAAMARVEAGEIALAELPGLRQQAKVNASFSRAAELKQIALEFVKRGDIGRAVAFDIGEVNGTETLALKAVWAKLTPATLRETFTALAGTGAGAAPAPRQMPGDGRSASEKKTLADRALATGVPAEIRAQAEAYVRASLASSTTE
jgi:hypothetical protein